MDAVFELTVRVEIVIWVFFNITDLICVDTLMDLS